LCLALVVIFVLAVPSSVAHRFPRERETSEEHHARHERRHQIRQFERTEMQQRLTGLSTLETKSYPACAYAFNCYATCSANTGFNSFIVNRCTEQVEVQAITSNYSLSYWVTIPGASRGNISNMFYYNTHSSNDYLILGPEIRKSDPAGCIISSGDQIINYCTETLAVQYFYTCSMYCQTAMPIVKEWITIPGFVPGSNANIVHVPYTAEYCKDPNPLCYGNAFVELGAHFAV